MLLLGLALGLLLSVFTPVPEMIRVPSAALWTDYHGPPSSIG